MKLRFSPRRSSHLAYLAAVFDTTEFKNPVLAAAQHNRHSRAWKVVRALILMKGAHQAAADYPK